MSILWIDENLPSTLGARLPGLRDFRSVCLLGQQIADLQLWKRAREDGGCILTKDADFYELLLMHGPPPKIVWIRVGNLRRQALENLLIREWDKIQKLLHDHDLVEVHADRLEAIRF